MVVLLTNAIITSFGQSLSGPTRMISNLLLPSCLIPAVVIRLSPDYYAQVAIAQKRDIRVIIEQHNGGRLVMLASVLRYN